MNPETKNSNIFNRNLSFFSSKKNLLHSLKSKFTPLSSEQLKNIPNSFNVQIDDAGKLLFI